MSMSMMKTRTKKKMRQMRKIMRRRIQSPKSRNFPFQELLGSYKEPG